MPSCAISTCSNTHRTNISPVTYKKIRFHRVPSKNEEIRKAWIKACRRKDAFNEERAIVCSDHFRPEDFERNLKAELLKIPFVPRLKADAVPNVNLTGGGNSGGNRRQKRRRKAKCGNEEDDSKQNAVNVLSDSENGNSASIILKVEEEDAPLTNEETEPSFNDASATDSIVPIPEPSSKTDNTPNRDEILDPSISAAFIPDRSNCLICYSSCPANIGVQLGTQKNNAPCSSLSTHLTAMFILRKVLELPLTQMEKYLSCCPNPEEWIVTCDKCAGALQQCQSIYGDLLETSRKFDAAKLELVEMIKTSAVRNQQRFKSRFPTITDASRYFVKNYDHEPQHEKLVNPFVEGDRLANQLERSRKPFIKLLSGRSRKKKLVRKFVESRGKESDSTEINTKSFPGLVYNLKCSEGVSISIPAEDVKRRAGEAFKEEVLEYSENEEEISTHHCTEDSIDSVTVYDDGDPLTMEANDVRKDVETKMEMSFRKIVLDREYDNQYNWEVDDAHIDENSDEGDDETVQFGNFMVSCPICDKFMCKVSKGELLCQHLETCSAEKITIASSEKDAETTHESSRLLICPVCGQFSVPILNKCEFGEHIGVCTGKTVVDGDLNNGDRLNIRVPLNCKIFKCDVCPQKNKFMKLKRFIVHFLHHKQMTRFACVKCPKKFVTQRAFHAHWCKNHMIWIKSISKLNRYKIVNRLPSVSWWCPHCDEQFPSEHLRNEHVNFHHPQKQHRQSHQCLECENKYFSEDELKLHWNTTHLPENTRFFFCEVCFEVFQKQKLLHSHRKKQHKRGLHSCAICGKKYSRRLGLNMHMQIHDDKKRANSLTCSVCNKVLSSRASLIQHVNAVHKKIVKFCCQVCGRPFTDNTSFVRHMANVHKIGSWKTKFFPCTVDGCSHKARSKDKLTYHLSWHNNDPQFNCSYCGKNFYFPEKLKRHELNHIITNPEDMPYQCQICSKRFIRNDLFRAHVRNHDLHSIRKTVKTDSGNGHTNATIYACTLCEKVLEGPRLLNKHKREEHFDAIRTCETCGKVFKNEYHLSHHVKIVHEKSYPVKICEYCGKGYRSWNMPRHYQQMHKELVADS